MRYLSRRTFVKGVGFSMLALGIAPAAVLSGCYDMRENLKSITDMGGRAVLVPREVNRVFCTNPIGTDNVLYFAPDLLAGWNFKPSGSSQDYFGVDLLALPSLGVWMGAGATPNVEEIAMQDPDVLLCYWTADEAGISMADSIRDETGFPVVLLDYTVQALPASYRFLGVVVGRLDAAEEIARFCEQKIELIESMTERVPSSARKSIFLAQGTGGLSTDPVGSMHVTDALELIKTANVAFLPGTEGQGMGMPTVNIEQILMWDPDAVLVSEYNMSDYQRSNVYGEIMSDPNWNEVPCVAAGEVYRIPQLPFTWFGRPPSALRLLGCLWLLRVLYPDYCGDIDVRSEAIEFIECFFGKRPTDDELDGILEDAGVPAAEEG